MAGGQKVPVPLGTGGGEAETIDPGTSARTRMPSPSTSATPPPVKPKPLTEDERQLAATSYGEGSLENVAEEMAAIANVLVRQSVARGYQSVASFIAKDKTFAFAAHDGNTRYKRLVEMKSPETSTDEGIVRAIAGARNALSATGTDHSNGGYFWDGADIKSNYANHPKVKAGIRFTDPAHNLYKIEEKEVPGEEWWRDEKGKKTKLRGKWTHKYESTAAFGGTIFWKLTDDFIKATGNKPHK